MTVTARKSPSPPAADSVPLGLDAPIGRRSVPEMVVERVLDLVRGGQLGAGDKLPSERDLAARLGVSRPSVREALRAISIMGVVEIRHGGGVYISSLDAAELLAPMEFYVSLSAPNLSEVFEARIHYEPMLAGIAAGALGARELARLGEIVTAQEDRPNDAELFHDTDAEFHLLILQAADNVFLSRVGRILQVLGEPGRRIFQRRPDVRARSVEDHRAILDALDARDADRAAAAMRVHMNHVTEALGETVDGE